MSIPISGLFLTPEDRLVLAGAMVQRGMDFRMSRVTAEARHRSSFAGAHSGAERSARSCLSFDAAELREVEWALYPNEKPPLKREHARLRPPQAPPRRLC